MKIPVFHDDQHGTAIIVGAAIKNALLLNGKTSRTSRSSARARALRRSPAQSSGVARRAEEEHLGLRSSTASCMRAATR
jgi:hypothetical protein